MEKITVYPKQLLTHYKAETREHYGASYPFSTDQLIGFAEVYYGLFPDSPLVIGAIQLLEVELA